MSSNSDKTCSSAERLFSHIYGTQAHPRCSFIVIGFIVIIFLGCLFFLNHNWYPNRTRRFTSTDFYEHGANSQYHYGIVIDCGSSGSRVFIYYWPPHNGNPDELLQIKQMKDPRGTPVRMKIKPGISIILFFGYFLMFFLYKYTRLKLHPVISILSKYSILISLDVLILAPPKENFTGPKLSRQQVPVVPLSLSCQA